MSQSAPATFDTGTADDLRQRLLTQELEAFHRDYAQFYLEGETKPKTVGEPFLLWRPEQRVGVLLVHGLMAAPEEVREWAQFLFAQGYTVYAPRMAGHGTSAIDLATRSVQEWEASVEQGYRILQTCCDEIVAAGFSTGAAIAMRRVIQAPDAFAALISISAPLKFAKFSARFAEPVRRLNGLLVHVGLARWSKPFVTNHADNPHINYLRCPVASIARIQQLMRQVKRALPSVQVPALVIHAKDDPKVDVRSGREIYRRLGSRNKSYREIRHHQHGIVRGAIAQEVFACVEAFLTGLFGPQPMATTLPPSVCSLMPGD